MARTFCIVTFSASGLEPELVLIFLSSHIIKKPTNFRIMCWHYMNVTRQGSGVRDKVLNKTVGLLQMLLFMVQLVLCTDIIIYSIIFAEIGGQMEL